MTTVPKIDLSKAHLVQGWKYDRPLLACRFSPSGAHVVTSSEDFSLQRWDLATDKPVVLKGHSSWVHALDFSRDGNVLVSGGCDGLLLWWAIAEEVPRLMRAVEAHQGWIRGVAFSPDGKMLASVGNDAVVRVWSAENGEKLAELVGHERHIYSLAFTMDGMHLLTGDLLGKIHLWDIPALKIERTLEATPLHTYEAGQRVDFGGVRSLALPSSEKHLLAGGLHKATNPLGNVHEPLILRFDYAGGSLLKSHVCDGIPNATVWRLQCLSDEIVVAVCGGNSGGFLLFFDEQNEKDVFRFKLPALARDMDLHQASSRIATVHADHHLRIVAF